MSTPVVTQDTLLERLMRRSDILLTLGVVAILVTLIIPLPSGFLDFALAFNIAFSLILLLSALYVTKPLELSVFPGMLLLVTLFRLALNVASTRLILAEGYAGQVIESFGNFVVEGNYVVGFIVFTILVIIQFVVITKGAGRISEVAARFTLDAMPGKQMAIDADLNAGLITDKDARGRREAIAREADFYGAMDGASKFVRGDAVAGILITLINVIGGFVIGVAMRDLPVAEAMRQYTLLSVGDGLVTQIPALIVSVAAGLLVTRTSSESDMGSEMARQITGHPRAIMTAGGIVAFVGLVPGMPTLAFLVLGAAVAGVGALSRRAKEAKADGAPAIEAEPKREERTEDLLKVDPIEVEIGVGLIPLVDPNQGGDLLTRVGAIRKELVAALGVIIPPVRVRDNIQLDTAQYRIKIHGVAISSYELMTDRLLAINPGYVDGDDLEGFATREPAFGLKAMWIGRNLREFAESKGFTVVEASAVVATHLTEILRANSADLLSRQDVSRLVDTLREDMPKLVEDTIPAIIPMAILQRVLQALLRERIPVRDLGMIVETVADFIGATKDPEALAEYTRMALRRRITDMHKDRDGKVRVFTVDPAVETVLSEALQSTRQGFTLALNPESADRIGRAVNEQARRMSDAGHSPILLCAPNVRLAMRKLMEPINANLVILSYNELTLDVEVMSSGVVRLTDDH